MSKGEKIKGKYGDQMSGMFDTRSRDSEGFHQ
jgi:hypothetical protein